MLYCDAQNVKGAVEYPPLVHGGNVLGRDAAWTSAKAADNVVIKRGPFACAIGRAESSGQAGGCPIVDQALAQCAGSLVGHWVLLPRLRL